MVEADEDPGRFAKIVLCGSAECGFPAGGDDPEVTPHLPDWLRNLRRCALFDFPFCGNRVGFCYPALLPVALFEFARLRFGFAFDCRVEVVPDELPEFFSFSTLIAAQRP